MKFGQKTATGALAGAIATFVATIFIISSTNGSVAAQRGAADGRGGAGRGAAGGRQGGGRTSAPLPKPVSSAAELQKLSGFTDPAALAYVNMAYETAGKAWPATLTFRCTAQMPHIVSGIPDPPATKVFDNLFYIGQADVGAWALNTSAGIILLDALNNEKDGRWIADQMPAVGLDPKQIKFIVITHEHGDHFGGAPYLKQTYGAKVAASQVAWDSMNKSANAPHRAADDVVLTDGGALTLGDTTVTSVLTPGHTPGTVSLIFPAKYRGATVMVAEWGGNGVPFTLEGRQQFRAGVQHFTDFTERAGVVAEVISHGDNDDLMARLDRARSGAVQSNPFLIGRESYMRYEAAMNFCASADVAQSIADARASK